VDFNLGQVQSGQTGGQITGQDPAVVKPIATNQVPLVNTPSQVVQNLAPVQVPMASAPSQVVQNLAPAQVPMANASAPVVQNLAPVQVPMASAPAPVVQNLDSAQVPVLSADDIKKTQDNLDKVEKEKSDKEIQNQKQILEDSILSGSIPQLVMIMISLALSMRSSDIHIEPLENHVRIRYRVDGVLMHIVEYPNNLHPAVVSRIKIMSNLKIDEQRVPQDGRADVTTKEGKEMDLRVSTLPTVNGEKIVMRLQDKSRKIPDLPELGIEGSSLKNLEESLKAPNGIIITTGPTGSGKTTTLYSCLNRKNTVEVNILTIEDPVEIQMDGLSQSQVHHDIDYDFATGMRAALRQDPDIIMVGEIRDKETADTAIEASLTGHLVFSTLHTNSAVESLTRMINMGVPGYLLNSTIELIIAQRLVRKLCEHCKKETQPDDEILEVVKNAMDNFDKNDEIDLDLVKGLKFYGPEGCDECNGIGYKGRVGLYEVMRMNNDIRRLISEEAPTMDIQKIAQQSGMITLEQAGIIKALKGETSLDEVYRVSRKSF